MQRHILTIICSAASIIAQAQQDTSKPKIPFEGIDMTWHNGNDRRDSSVFKGVYFIPSILLDVNYNYSFNNPIDNTVV